MVTKGKAFSCTTWRSWGWSLCLSIGCLLHGWHIGVQASGTQYTIRAAIAAPVCRVQCTYLCSDLLFWLSGILECTLGSSAGFQASRDALWALPVSLHQIWLCRIGTAASLALKAGLQASFWSTVGLGCLQASCCRGVSSPQASKTLSHSPTAAHCIDRDGGKLDTGQRWSGHRNSCGHWGRDREVVLGNCIEVLQAMLSVGHQNCLFTREVLWGGLCSLGNGAVCCRKWHSHLGVYLKVVLDFW